MERCLEVFAAIHFLIVGPELSKLDGGHLLVG
jgi:hypothetical protein